MNIGIKLREIVEKKKNDVAFVFKDVDYTYEKLEQETNKVANFLKELGVEKGTKVGIYMLNNPEYIYSYFALFKIGAIAVPLDHRLKTEELFPLLNHCKAEFLITTITKTFDPEIIIKNVPSLKNIIITKGNFQKCISMEEKIKNISSDFPIKYINESDIAAIFYTSGTTGIPKGVIWTYRHLDSPIDTIFNYYKYFQENDVCICPIPFSHNGGIVGVLLILFGIKLVVMEYYQPLELLQNLQKYNVTGTFLVPTMFIGMLNLSEFDKFHLPSLRWAAVFGAPFSPEVIKKFNKVCPQAKLLSGYGLTETAAPNFLPPLDNVKFGSVGKPVPWIDVKIIDEDGVEVKKGEVGEIIIKGWPVTPGYYNQPDLTSQVIKDGWLYTGDLGKFDEDGYLYIVGRKKEVIIVGGLNVYPNEVEGVIHKYPKVKEVAVVGVSDKLKGEAVKAVIVPKEGEEITEKEIINFCRQHLASYKVPTIVEFRKELPKTGSGKIKKELLK
ncbi:MAG: AMP-binding protein [Candidatus Omnitrophica bacterium]|nr:AMP-binding protein [Candidatus Omnitrophota bacterium]MCM8803407.1 AMP-binding protein [Candidatus Omnitrophota bacterium]